MVRCNRVETLDAQAPSVFDESSGLPHAGELFLNG
jgi:hypothetical protein